MESLDGFSVRRKACHLETQFCCLLDSGCVAVKMFLTVKDIQKPQINRISKAKLDGKLSINRKLKNKYQPKQTLHSECSKNQLVKIVTSIRILVNRLYFL